MIPHFVVFSLFVALAAPPVFAGEVSLDRLAAVVGEEVITLSEVKFEARLALLQQDPARGAAVLLEDRLLSRQLEEIAARTLLVLEVRRLRLLDPAEKEEAQRSARRAALAAALGPALKAAQGEFGITDLELDALVLRRYYAERFITERLSGAPTDAEVRAFYQEHPDLFGGKPLREVYDEAARLAQRELIKRRLVAYLDELHARFGARVFFPAALKEKR